MNFLRNLFGKKPVQVAADATKSTPATETSGHTAAASPDAEGVIRAHDAYGREILIPKAQWRDSVLLGSLEKARGNPDELAALITQSLRDGFAADVLPFAAHLAATDANAERGHVLHAVALLDLKRHAEAEAVLVRFGQKHGETGVSLANLAKAMFARGNEGLAMATLWRALNLDPNQDNALAWYESIHREQDGAEAGLAAIGHIAALPRAWRARLWLARDSLGRRDLGAALALYNEALGCAPRPVPPDLLVQMSGDLGNHAHLPELLQLTTPHFDIALHGLAVGNNLIKAHLDLGQIDAARALLDLHYAQQRPDWREALAKWDTEIAQARVSTETPPTPATKIEVTLLAMAGPVWLPSDSPAADLFPAKADDAPIVAFLGGSAEMPTPANAGRVHLADGPGRLSRALPLYLAEQTEFATAASAQTLIAWMVQPAPGFILGGKPWDDTTASHHARRAGGETPADYLVITHLICTAEPWQIELRLVRTIDGVCLATASAPCPLADPGQACAELLQTLLGLLAAHTALPALSPVETGAPAPIAPELRTDYLVRLEQLLAVRTAAMPQASGRLNGEREILEGQLRLCLAQPASLSIRLLFAHTLRGLAAIKPEIADEFQARAELLQNEHPLPEPAHSVVGRLVSETFGE